VVWLIAANKDVGHYKTAICTHVGLFIVLMQVSVTTVFSLFPNAMTSAEMYYTEAGVD